MLSLFYQIQEIKLNYYYLFIYFIINCAKVSLVFCEFQTSHYYDIPTITLVVWLVYAKLYLLNRVTKFKTVYCRLCAYKRENKSFKNPNIGFVGRKLIKSTGVATT